MENPKNVQPPEERFDPQMESFKYQLELLKLEIKSINETIGRIDKITQEAKNWAIVTWAGSIAIALGEPSLRKYIVLTALLPFLFWYIDARWRYLQRRSGFRSRKIGEFLNDGRLQQSFEQKKVGGLHGS